MNIISTDKAPKAIGPYSQAIEVNGIIYTSGQLALTPDGNDDKLYQDVEIQTRQVLDNIKSVLSQAGSSLNKVIKTTIFLANMDDFAIVNTVYASYFSAHKPVRSTVAVKTLPKNAKIEIDVIASK